MARASLQPPVSQDGFSRDTRSLADRVFGKSRAMDVILVLTGAELMAILAQVAIPVWPVPITGQLVGVLVVGFSLGLIRGTLSAAVYLLMGLVGFPVYSDGNSGYEHLIGPTGGYLFGFVLAAMIAGLFAAREWDRTFWRALVAATVCTAAIFAVGVPWLAFVNGYDVREALEYGLLPIIIGTMVKLVLIAAMMTGAWAFILRADDRAERAAKEPSPSFYWNT